MKERGFMKRKEFEQKSTWRRLTVFLLTMALVAALTGCGGTGAAIPQDVQNTGNGYVYVSEYIDLDFGSDMNFGNVLLKENYLYYSIYTYNEETYTSKQDFYRKEILEGAAAEKLPVQIPDDIYVMQYFVDEEGNYYFAGHRMSETQNTSGGYSATVYYLLKYDGQGNLVFEQDISEQLTSAGENAYIQYLVIDEEGRFYIAGDNLIWLFNADGSYSGNFQVTNWIYNMFAGKDGKVYFSQYGTENIELVEVDFAAKGPGNTYQKFLSAYNSNQVTPGYDQDFIVNDGSKLYTYDLSTQTNEELLSWLDSDINGQYVSAFAMGEDGRIAVLLQEWGQDGVVTEFAYLTKTKEADVAQKEIITLGTLYTDQWLQSAAVIFNKTNDKYRIKIKVYMDDNYASMDAYSNAVTALNNDILAGGPDLISLSYGDTATYAAKGVLEDLNTYLEKSTELNRDDFVESVLSAYTYEDILTCIPIRFSVSTVVGKTSLVGEEMGCTVEDLIAFSAEYPEAQIFEYMTKSQALYYCLIYNQDAFIDTETGECHFDSDEFKKILEYTNMFPDEYSYDENLGSTPNRLQAGEILLYEAYMYSVEDLQFSRAVFEAPVTYIGYPTVDGSAGCMMSSMSGAFGISSTSDNKEGAWSFIEYILDEDNQSSSYYSYGFPSQKKLLNQMFEEAMTEDYVLDENGETLLDENGEAVRAAKTTWGWDDWETTIYAADQSDIDLLNTLIDLAKPAVNSDSQVLTIINEEAAAYFAGQKSVDEVTAIIQNRAQIYVSENR